jgi:hypothetical protein
MLSATSTPPAETSSGACLSDELVVDFLSGSLSAERIHEIEAHLDRCDECRALLGAAAHVSLPPLNLLQAMERDDDGVLGKLQTSPGTILAGRFELRSMIGRGGMGVVFEAHDQLLQIPVALKVLRPELTTSVSQLLHLHQEIVLGRRISHPHVCRIYDIGTAGPGHFITMELVQGPTLEAHLAKTRYSPARVVGVLSDVLAALEAAHREGVIHRDLKPSNIMLDGTGGAKVMDFGLALDLETDARSGSRPAGTPAYWSPEQARGEALGPPSDLFSVGVIAVRMLTGRRPERGVLPEGLVPHAFGPWLERMLAASPGDRWPTAAAAAEGLERAHRLHRRRGRLGQVMLAAGLTLTALGLLGWGFGLGLLAHK